MGNCGAAAPHPVRRFQRRFPRGRNNQLFVVVGFSALLTPTISLETLGQAPDPICDNLSKNKQDFAMQNPACFFLLQVFKNEFNHIQRS